MSDYDQGYRDGESSVIADLQAMVDEKGVAFLLDHLERDGLANEYERLIRIEQTAARLLATPADEFMPFGAMESAATHKEFDEAWDALRSEIRKGQP